jgi:hypothetical protein
VVGVGARGPKVQILHCGVCVLSVQNLSFPILDSVDIDVVGTTR